jgi:nitrite reductase/ring-hydroxylating ferredoxin subunit
VADARATEFGEASTVDPRSEPKASEAAGWADIPVALPPPGGMAAFELDGLELVLCNAAGAPCVIEDRCPHADVALSEGRLEGAVLECPLHGGKLDVRSGAPAAPPIRRPVRTFAVRQHGEQLQVEVSPHA